MPADLFAGLLRIAAVQFAVGSVLVQVRVFRSFARGLPAPDLRRTQRIAYLSGAVAGLVPALAGFAFWVPPAWSRARWDVLVGLEILLAFVLLAVGLAAAAVRFSHPAIPGDSGTRIQRRELLVRAGILTAGWVYAAAIAIRIPGGPGETLFAVTALGAITLALGLARGPTLGS